MDKGKVIATDKLSSAKTSLSFDLCIFDLDTIKKALIKFTNTASYQLDLKDNNRVNISFTIIDPSISGEKLEHLIKNEVLDQDLRKKIALETEGVRNLILANAFSDTKLISFEE